VNRPNIPLTAELDGKHKGRDIVIVGCAKYINDLDLHRLDGLVTIGCNRILRHPYFRPRYLMVADRRPYIAEMKEGRYEQYADEVTMLFSTSMYDPKIKCHGTPVQSIPSFKWLPWRACGSSSALNWKTLSESLNSFANAGGPLLQAAVIMGARRVGMVGLGIIPPGNRGKQFKKDDPWRKYHGSPPNTTRCFKRAKEDLGKMRIEVCNLSLENALLEQIFPRYPFEQFVEEAV